MRLTDSAVQRLQTIGRDYVQYEPGGFGVRVTASGKKHFVFQARVSGRPTRFPLGAVDDVTITEARRKADGIRGQLAAGLDPRAQVREKKREEVTLAEFWEGYQLRARLRIKAISLAGYKAIMKKHILPRLGSRTVASIGRADAWAMHDAILKQAKKGRDNLRTANKACQVLRLILTDAEGRVIKIGSNELKGMRLPGDKQRKVFLKDEHVHALEDAFDKLRGKGVSAMAEAFLRTMLLTGARGGELQRLEWTMIDEERQLAMMEGKNGDMRVIPLAGAWDIIQGLPRAGRLVFWGRTPELPYKRFRTSWRMLRTAAGLGDDIKPHELRHSFASAVLAQNYALPVVGALLGHRSVASTKRYSHLAETAANAVASEAAAAIKSAAKGEKVLGKVRRA